MVKKTRGFISRLVDQITGWSMGLPQERCTFTVTTIRIPISDGLDRIELLADLFRPVLPDGDKPRSTILSMGPYGRGFGMVLPTRLFAARGYQALVVSCRGTYGSGGVFDPARTEFHDTHAVVEWMRAQPWYTGSFATFGASYLGFIQFALLSEPPPDMVAAAITVAPHDFSRRTWGTGSLDLGLITWSDFIANQDESGAWWAELKRPYYLITAPNRLRPILEGAPGVSLIDLVDAHFKDKVPWLRQRILISDRNDPYWEATQQDEALERAVIPILLVGGWYDIFLEQTMHQYARLRQRGCTVALTVGPWTHSQASRAKDGSVKQSFRWVENQVSGVKECSRAFPVEIFVTGAEEWRNLEVWPPQIQPMEMYLQSGKRLLKGAPADEEESVSQFTFDPSKPTNIMGGAQLFGAAKVNDGALANASDILTFTTEPLTNGVDVMGKIVVELVHSSDNPHIDLFVRISDVNPRGQSHNITEIFRRITPDRGPRPLRLELRDCAHRFKKGHSIRLIVAGGCHPFFARNLGTGENQGTGKNMVPATHSLHHGASRSSKVSLPVFAPVQ